MSDLPQGWRKLPVGEIVESAIDGPFGSNLKTEHYVDSPGVRVVRLQNIGSGHFDDRDRAYVSSLHARRLARHQVIPGDLLVASLGDENHPVARACLYPEEAGPAIVKADCFRLRPSVEVASGGYLALVLNNPSARRGIEGYFQGVTRDRINLASLMRFSIIVPPLSEQRRIVEILDAVDARVNSAIAERSKIQRFKEGLAQSLIPVRPDPGVLGSDWKLVRLSEVVPSADYGISTSLELGVSGTPTLRMNNLVDGGIRLHEVKVSTEAVPPKLILRHGDVLFNRTNSFEHVGRTSMWRSELPVATFASYLVRLNPDLRQLVPEYLVRWLNRPAIQQRIRRVATPGVHQVNINPTSLRKTLIELPADPIRQQGIVSALAEAEARVLKLRVEHQRLLALKQGLVNDLLSGRVRV